jgi:hypothetical protein
VPVLYEEDRRFTRMGCNQSTADTRLQTVDDSVHVMLAHDKKVQQQRGEQPHGYVPRADHPLLKPKAPEAAAGDVGGGGGSATAASGDSGGGPSQ